MRSGSASCSTWSPRHTSIEHPWFREHPDWYVWSDDGPPNNWLAAFGGAGMEP